MMTGARMGSLIAGSLVVLCVAILATDYAMADRQPFAARPAAEQKRVTEARLARKSRDNAVAWVLIAAAATFLTFAKGLVGPEKPRAPGERRQAKAPGPLRSAAATELDLSFVEQLVSQIGRGKEAAIPLLGAIQKHYRYLPDDALRRVCELTDITPAEIAGTSSFYGQFRRSPVGEHIVRVCHGTACHVSGARQITEELRRYLAIPDGEDTDAARMFTLDEVACLGCCSLAPVLMVDGHTAGKLTPATACDALKVTA
jgi:NADH:ubiquinone oxidoreductase subunit E